MAKCGTHICDTGHMLCPQTSRSSPQAAADKVTAACHMPQQPQKYSCQHRGTPTGHTTDLTQHAGSGLSRGYICVQLS